MTPAPSALVGRDQPLAELRALVEAALASRGGVVTLTGEAGIGKTTLAMAAADHAEARGATVVWGTCWEGAPPFWPWLEVLAALGIEAGLQDAGPPGQPAPLAGRFERFHAASGALLEAAGATPLVVVLDDLHWADPASVELAAFHARRARRSPQLLVATYRDVEIAPGGPLGGPIARLEAEGRTVPLGGLDAPQVAEVLAGVTGGEPDPGLGTSVQRRTGGNPFLVQQVARLLATHPDATAVPHGVRDAIQRRLAALGDPGVRLLEAAAVLGPDPRPAVLARVAGQPAGEVLALLGQAVAARVLVGPADELGAWRFAHDLFREVLYGQLDPAARARLHLAAAAALEAARQAGSEVRPAELAGHYLRAVDQGGEVTAADAARAVGYSELAAQEAAAVLADEDAAGHYRRALRLAAATGQLGPDGRARLLVGLGEALRRSGDTTGARQAFRDAADLARASPAGGVDSRRTPPPGSAGGVDSRRTPPPGSATLPVRGPIPAGADTSVPKAGPSAAGADASVPKAGPFVPEGALARDELGGGLARDELDGAPAREDLGGGLPRDDLGAELARAALGLHAVGVESGADPAEVAGLLEAALARTSDAPALAAQVESALAQTLAWAPDPDPGRAAAMAERAVATARTTGDPHVLAAALLGRHNVLWGPDTPSERLAVLAELERLAADDEELAAEAQLLRATVLLELGDARAAALLAAFARRARRSRLARVRWLGRSREGMLAVLTGDLDLADRLAAEARRLGDELRIPDTDHVTAGLRAGIDSLRGRPSPELLDAVERLVGRVDVPVTSPRGWMSVMLLLKGDRPAWVDAYARGALDVDPDDVPRDWMWLRSAVILAELNAAAGDAAACARWYDALAPYQDRTAVAGGAVLFVGAVAHYLGLLAAVCGRPGPARRHLEDAAAVHERLGARPWLLRSRLELGRLLRDDPARRDQTDELLRGVLDEAGRLGCDALAATATGLLEAAGLAGPAEFRRSGTAWTVGYAGRTARLPDAKGMRDLAVLLSRPGQPVPAAELVALSGGGRPARADLAMGADAVLDDQAKRAYRRRVEALDREVADAEDQGDPDRAEKARAERDAIAHELAAALGLGGRDRGLGDLSERARKAVTERIRYSMARIAAVHPGLAAHLQASVTTGSSCAYTPTEPVTWLT